MSDFVIGALLLRFSGSATRRHTLAEMLCGLRWYAAAGALTLAAVWFAFLMPLLTGSFNADVYRAPLAEISTPSFSSRCIDTFALALGQTMVAIGEWCTRTRVVPIAGMLSEVLGLR